MGIRLHGVLGISLGKFSLGHNFGGIALGHKLEIFLEFGREEGMKVEALGVGDLRIRGSKFTTLRIRGSNLRIRGSGFTPCRQRWPAGVSGRAGRHVSRFLPAGQSAGFI